MFPISIPIQKLNLLVGSFTFIKRHFRVIVGLGLIAAFGRVAQLGGFGEIPRWLHVLLEFVVELSRLLMILFVIGKANINKAITSIVGVFRARNFGAVLKRGWVRFKNGWVVIVVNFVAFALVAAGINLLIDQLAYQTCLLLQLKGHGLIENTASEWTILLFFKNIMVIPLTLVFESLLLLWLIEDRRAALNEI